MVQVSRTAILVTIINLALILIFIIFVSKIISANSFSIKIKKFIVILFCIVFLASLAILNFIPNKKLIKNDYSVNNVYGQIEDFKQLAIKGKLNLSKQYIKKVSKVFTYTDKQLKISAPADGDVEIVVQRKKEDDGKIETADYLGKFIFNDINVSNIMESLNVQLKNNTLTINGETQKQIKIARFGYDISTSQFIMDNSSQHDSFKTIGNLRKILIKIPASVQIDSEYDDIEYAEDRSGK